MLAVVAISISTACSAAPKESEVLPADCQPIVVRLGSPDRKTPVTFAFSGGRAYFTVTKSRLEPFEFPVGNKMGPGDDYVRIYPAGTDPIQDLKGVKYLEMRTGNLASVKLPPGEYSLNGSGAVSVTICTQTLQLR